MRIEPVAPTSTVNRADRVQLGRPATMRDLSRAPIDVIIENLSETGALLVSEDSLPVGSLISLGIAGAGVQLARITRADSGTLAAEFMVPLDPVAVSRAQSAETIVSIAFPQMLVEHRVETAPPGANSAADTLPGKPGLPSADRAGSGVAEATVLTYGPTAARNQPIPYTTNAPEPDPRAIAALLPQQPAGRTDATARYRFGLWSFVAAVIVTVLFYLIV